MDLREILPDSGQEQPTIPPTGAEDAGLGQIKPAAEGVIQKLMESTGGEGIKKLSNTVLALIVKVLESLLVAYGTNSDEGETIMRAIKSLSKFTKGIQVSDLQTALKSIVSSLPQNMQSITPNGIIEALGQPKEEQPQPMPTTPAAGGLENLLKEGTNG